jgi:hypothetical protein
MPRISELFRVLDGDVPASAELRLGKVLPTIERYWNKGDFGAVRREALAEIERLRPVLRGFFSGRPRSLKETRNKLRNICNTI